MALAGQLKPFMHVWHSYASSGFELAELLAVDWVVRAAGVGVVVVRTGLAGGGLGVETSSVGLGKFHSRV